MGAGNLALASDMRKLDQTTRRSADFGGDPAGGGRISISKESVDGRGYVQPRYSAAS